ncbi:hypothetical protein B0H12DRAFT_311714 [Mycena haematopus]|nr:hypothetical protein B0H12DRAFT_311714 [Mycena haematopus]
MRGLAIPANDAGFDREPSNDYGTESSNNDDNIPIDPALGGTPIDPTLLGDHMSEQNHPTNTEPARTPPHDEPSNQYNQYSEAPQGDPFAPQPEFHPTPDEPPPMSPSKPARRRRGPPRQRECGFCGQKKAGQTERMATCHDCGRSAHPSCLQLSPSIGELIQTYNWVCIECKKCELCHNKGDDARILFCDSCDRGWHMDCLEPPVEDMPVGKWYCPRCPNAVETEREPSVASSSHSATPRTRKGKAKATPIPSDNESDDEDESDDDQEEKVEAVKRTRGRPRGSEPTRKPKRPRVDSHEQASPSRAAKRKRTRPLPLPSAPPLPTPTVRLRIPKARRRRHEDEEPPGLFDEILTLDERDTSKTAIAVPDKQKFDKSRAVAEVDLSRARP